MSNAAAREAALLTRVRKAVNSTTLTDSEFAERIGITSDKFSKSMTGTRRFSSFEIARIAEVSGLPVGWILDTDYEVERALQHRVEELESALASRPVPADHAELIARTRSLIEERRHSRGYLEPDYSSLSRSMSVVMQELVAALEAQHPTTQEWGVIRGDLKKPLNEPIIMEDEAQARLWSLPEGRTAVRRWVGPWLPLTETNGKTP